MKLSGISQLPLRQFNYASLCHSSESDDEIKAICSCNEPSASILERNYYAMLCFEIVLRVEFD